METTTLRMIERLLNPSIPCVCVCVWRPTPLSLPSHPFSSLAWCMKLDGINQPTGVKVAEVNPSALICTAGSVAASNSISHEYLYVYLL